MTERRKILDLFDEQNDYVEEKVSHGIETYRKGDGKVRIVDKNGKPVVGAKIKFSQKSHEFRFGANIFMLDELETPEKNDIYKKCFADVFNMATLPFYWDALEPERGKPRYAKDSPKVYRRPAPDLFFPKWLYDAEIDEVKAELERRYSEIAERYADKIPTIEVTNEMKHARGKTKFYDDPDFVEWCFRLAEKYFPNNQLGINESRRFAWCDNCRTSDSYYAYTEAAMLKGARIDAIGMQYHLFNKLEEEYEKSRQMLNPRLLYAHMDMYSRLGKPLQITEITIPSYSWNPEDEELQAEMLEKLYSVWFSHPNVEQIIYWNLVDGYAHLWDPDPDKIRASQGDMSLGENYYYGGLLRFDMSPKPAYFKLKELLQEKWHTEAKAVTDADGCTAFRGFYGKYDVEINGKTVAEIALSKKTDNEFIISLK